MERNSLRGPGLLERGRVALQALHVPGRHQTWSSGSRSQNVFNHVNLGNPDTDDRRAGQRQPQRRAGSPAPRRTAWRATCSSACGSSSDASGRSRGRPKVLANGPESPSLHAVLATCPPGRARRDVPLAGSRARGLLSRPCGFGSWRARSSSGRSATSPPRRPTRSTSSSFPRGSTTSAAGRCASACRRPWTRPTPSGHDAVALAYGLCNNGLAGLEARRVPLVLLRAHDCITAFLGSRDRYARYFEDRPGTYFETTGWLERGVDGGPRTACRARPVRSVSTWRPSPPGTAKTTRGTSSRR